MSESLGRCRARCVVLRTLGVPADRVAIAAHGSVHQRPCRWCLSSNRSTSAATDVGSIRKRGVHAPGGRLRGRKPASCPIHCSTYGRGVVLRIERQADQIGHDAECTPVLDRHSDFRDLRDRHLGRSWIVLTLGLRSSGRLSISLWRRGCRRFGRHDGCSHNGRVGCRLHHRHWLVVACCQHDCATYAAADQNYCRYEECIDLKP